MATSRQVDVVVVGAGIVGLATAHALLDALPRLRLAVIEKEPRVATHQSGRNSGILHSGLYYRPGSLKAQMAVEGRRSMLRFCGDHGIPHKVCGKLVVAVDAAEVSVLETLAARALANGVVARTVGPDELHDLEPFVTGRAGLHVAGAGVVDFGSVSRALADEVTSKGAELRVGCEVIDLLESAGSVAVETTGGDLEASVVVNCGGLQADLLARRALRARLDLQIVPFRGEFHELVASKRYLIRSLVYPVPNPALPFLGVHLSRGVDDRVVVGPNAILALAREGYSWRAMNARELVDLARFPGVWRLARQHWRTGAGEVWRSLRLKALVGAVRRLVPELRAEDLVSARAGVRAQAVDRTGRLLDDFVIRETPGVVHVLNAPSPAATASLEIGRSIAARVVRRFP